MSIRETRILIAAVGLLVFLASFGVGQEFPEASPPTVELPPELARVLTDYEKAYRIGGEELAPLFAEDGFVLAGGRPPVRGRAAIAAYYGDGGGPLSLRAIAYEVSGSVGYMIGGYALEQGSPDDGKFTLALQKGPDGRWLIFSDMDNSNHRND
ncbi:MAG TPA: DUF4440 domain-containing protein [Acidobacteriota bacterium]|nr:DUF4440 domain-containing protein [Acidobacteriota bacterium]